MFERYTEKARQVIVLSQDEARALGHNYIGTEHLLLGLLREEDGVAHRVLVGLKVDLATVRSQVERIIGHGTDVTTGQVPFTPRANKVLELSLREALSLGHNYVGAEHILLGLVRENEGVAARILLDFDANAEKIRNEIIRTLSPRRAKAPAQPTVPTLLSLAERLIAAGEAVRECAHARTDDCRQCAGNLTQITGAVFNALHSRVVDADTHPDSP